MIQVSTTEHRTVAVRSDHLSAGVLHGKPVARLAVDGRNSGAYRGVLFSLRSQEPRRFRMVICSPRLYGGDGCRGVPVCRILLDDESPSATESRGVGERVRKFAGH